MYFEDEGLSSLMGMDEPIEEFIHTYVDSFIKWEIIQYGHEHAGAWFKSSDVADFLNRPHELVKKEVQELAATQLLQSKKIGKQQQFSYQPAADAQGRKTKLLTDQFIQACKTREGRLRVIYKILKNGKPIAG